MESLIIVFCGTTQKKLRQLADWAAHGFNLIAEVQGRDDAISMIISKSPSLTILDASMPLSELHDIMEITRSRGYKGRFLPISSKSDFKAAQTAINCGADKYIVTPIAPAAFAAVLKEIRENIEQRRRELQIFDFLSRTAKQEILRNIILSGKMPSEDVIRDLHLDVDSYQVAIFELTVSESSAAFPTFAEFIKSSGFDRISYESFSPASYEVILIKGSLSIELLRELLAEPNLKYHSNAGFFISLGSKVSSLSSANLSFSQARYASERKFLVPGGIFMLSYENCISVRRSDLSAVKMEYFRKQLIDGLQTFKRHNLLDVIEALREYMTSTQATSYDAKMFLADLFLQVKESFMRLYSTSNIPFAANTEILSLIARKAFLHDVLAFYSEQFELIMSSIGSTSRDSVLDDVFYYIAHNYSEPIKLETLASLFGYNSAYLGKIFHKAAGMSFNNYVDKLRVEHSMKLLRDGDMKVYEIARQVGYKSVDYFHKKFRAHTGESPAEYRKKLQIEEEI